MKPQTYLLPALAALINAQSTSSQCKGPLTVQNQGDITAIQGCKTFNGSLKVANTTSGQLNIAGIQSIDGDLIIDGAQISMLSADTLQSVSGAFTMTNLPFLSSNSFPYLTSVGDLTIQNVPTLDSLGFTQTVKSIKSINIQNNFLSSLDGLDPESLDGCYIANNRYLQDISFSVTSISGVVVFQSNGDHLNVQLPNLLTAQNLTFQNCPTVNIDSLVNTTGSLIFHTNTLSSISAVNLTSVGSDLAIVANPNLMNFSLPALQTIGGGFSVQNNTQLTQVDMPALGKILGALDFFGSFDSVTIPKLRNCQGSFNIQSSSSSLNCSFFNAEKSQNLIQGKYVCAPNVSAPGNITNTPSGTKKNTADRSMVGSSAALILSGALALLMATL